MKDEWIRFCQWCINEKADFYSGGSRKILRSRSFTFNSFKDNLTLKEIGYSKQKLTLLRNLYYHAESVAHAADLYQYLIDRGKYSSACFHTYNHMVKPGARSPKEKRSTRSPCLQSVVLTLTERKTTSVDVFYRTTEIFKKFPADLVFLDTILRENFKLEKAPLDRVSFHFANITCHPMYIPVILPLVKDPYPFIKSLPATDTQLGKEAYRWLERYLGTNKTVRKFRQANAVRKKLETSLDDDTLDKIYNHVRKARR